MFGTLLKGKKGMTMASKRGVGRKSSLVMKIHLDLQISLGIASVVRFRMNLTEKCKEK